MKNIQKTMEQYSMLINFSNHPVVKWNETQLNEAVRLFGSVVDFPFPEVDPESDEHEVSDLAKQAVDAMLDMAGGKKFAVHAMGEMNLTFAVVELLKKAGITCVASTTKRNVKEIGPQQKEIVFEFVKFRKY